MLSPNDQDYHCTLHNMRMRIYANGDRRCIHTLVMTAMHVIPFWRQFWNNGKNFEDTSKGCVHRTHLFIIVIMMHHHSKTIVFDVFNAINIQNQNEHLQAFVTIAILKRRWLSNFIWTNEHVNYLNFFKLRLILTYSLPTAFSNGFRAALNSISGTAIFVFFSFKWNFIENSFLKLFCFEIISEEFCFRKNWHQILINAL